MLFLKPKEGKFGLYGVHCPSYQISLIFCIMSLTKAFVIENLGHIYVWNGGDGEIGKENREEDG